MAHPLTRRLPSGELAVGLPSLTLVVVDGPDRTQSARFEGRTLRVGSAPDNDLVLTDPTASRHHLELRSEGDRVFLKDLASTNGTFVGDVHALHAIVGAGSSIRVGETTMQLEVHSESMALVVSERSSFGELVGKSLPMRELYAVLEKVSGSDSTVLLHGETGTGKELAARAIHHHSPRASGPFVVVDCGATPPELFEAELFGHEKGAFTGAVTSRPGLLVQAHGGTLFLDEIGELALRLQPKLLRALERRQVRPVGATETIDVDVRLVAASHRDLREEVNRGAFREDLYFRLAVIRVSLPPLRTHREDLPALVRRFVAEAAPEREDEYRLIAQELAHRSFPGNVRELRNAVDAFLLLGGADLGSGSSEDLYSLPYRRASDLATTEFRREYVKRLLDRAEGNVSEAARIAGMSRRFLQTLIDRLGS